MSDVVDYPTDEELGRLEHWPPYDVAGALDFAASLWHWPDLAARELTAGEASVVRAEPGERYLRLATGGWSGNEEIVAALKTNMILRSLSWRLSAAGGLHIFQYPNPRKQGT